MTTRTLKDGSQVLELENPKTLTVYTRCPEKYRLIDMETGEQYVGFSSDGPSSWKKVELCQI
jgi:hypothetical protein